MKTILPGLSCSRAALPVFRYEVEFVGLAALRRMIGPGGNSRFGRAVFTPSERRYCGSHRMLLEHYGARLAAKRAVLKALGLKSRDTSMLKSVEIKRFENGQPYVRLPGRFFRRQGLPSGIRIEVSLAHERKVAAACALAVFP
jgi:phosphopantetheine--protein transferase-like protein